MMSKSEKVDTLDTPCDDFMFNQRGGHMAFISVNCSCGKSFKIESSKAGRKIRCACGAVLLVPDVSEAPAPEALGVSESGVGPKKAARLPQRSKIDTQSYDAESKSNVIKLGLIGVAVVILCLGLVFAYTRMKPAPIVHKGHDADALAYIRDASEAREWLKGRDMMLGGMLHKQAEFKINQWYEMGVKTIYIKGRPAMQVVMELPDDAEKRKTIFDWYVNFVQKTHDTPAPDEGQRFLLVNIPQGDVN